jgi:hypothetical protein
MPADNGQLLEIINAIPLVSIDLQSERNRRLAIDDAQPIGAFDRIYDTSCEETDVSPGTRRCPQPHEGVHRWGIAR